MCVCVCVCMCVCVCTVPPAPATTAMEATGIPRKVVYVPSCVTRMMGPAATDSETASVHEKLMSLFSKAGYEVRPCISPHGLCVSSVAAMPAPGLARILMCTMTHFCACVCITYLQVIIPKQIESQCCGMMFNSRGFKDAAASKGAALEKALLEASQNGKLPIVVDTSPCLSQVRIHALLCSPNTVLHAGLCFCGVRLPRPAAVRSHPH